MKLTGTDLSKYKSALKYEEPRPVRDWFVLLGVVFLLVVGSIAWNLWTLQQVIEGETLDGEVAGIGPRAVRLESVTALFERRALEAGRYADEYRFVDPSVRAGTVPAPSATTTISTTTATTSAQ